MSATVGDVITHEGRLVVIQRLTRFAAFLFDLVEQPDGAERARYGVVCAEPDQVTGRTPVDPATLSGVNRQFIDATLAGGLPHRVTGRTARTPRERVQTPAAATPLEPVANPMTVVNAAPAVTETVADAAGGPAVADATPRVPRTGQKKKRVVLTYRLATAAPREEVVAAFAPTKAVVVQPLASIEIVPDGYRVVVQYEPPNAGGSRHDVERIVARAVRRLADGGHAATAMPEPGA